MIGVISLGMAGESDEGAVMEIIVPERVHAVAAFFLGLHKLRVLRFVFVDEIERSVRRGGAGTAGDLGENVILRCIDDGLRGVEAKAVEVEFGDPVDGIGNEELADGGAVVAVEVNCFAPIGGVLAIEESIVELIEIISIGADVVVDEIENDADAGLVGAIDKLAEIIGRSVVMEGSEEIDAVISPAERAGEFVDGHDFETGDAEVSKFGKLFCGGVPGSFRGEGADVHFVKHLAVGGNAGPGVVGPVEGGGVDDLRRAMGAVGLEAGGGIGERLLGAIEAKAISCSGPGVGGESAEIAVGFCG